MMTLLMTKADLLQLMTMMTQRNHEEEIGSDIVITRLTAHAHCQTRPPGPVNSSQYAPTSCDTKTYNTFYF